jgi:electron transport complex protein RnfD
MILFGLGALRVLLISLTTAVVVEVLLAWMLRRSRHWSRSYAMLTGAFFACTLPPNLPTHLVITGTLLAVLLEQMLLGGIGNQLWHPVALSRVIMQLLFHDHFVMARWIKPTSALLTPKDQLLQSSWASLHSSSENQTLLLTVFRPADVLRHPMKMTTDSPAAELISLRLRDQLPDWTSTLIGTAGGAIGEACFIAVVLAGLILLWQGFLHGRMLATASAAVLLAGAILPVRMLMPNGTIEYLWLPGAAVWEGLPVGLVHTFYYLTAGGLPFVIMVLAADPATSPLMVRGHVIFGILIAVLTVALTTLTGIPAAAYWALLAANTCVPIIDRLTRRRVFGTKLDRRYRPR